MSSGLWIQLEPNIHKYCTDAWVWLDGACCLVCEFCRLSVVCVDCRRSLSFVFLGGSWRVELSLCNMPVVMSDLCSLSSACKL